MKPALAVLLLLMLFVISGCQLALPDVGENTPDRLVGVFITREHLDLFDIEGYLNEQVSSFTGNHINFSDSEIRFYQSTEKFEGRIYASFSNDKYVFENIEGFPFFSAEYSDDLGHVTKSYHDEAVSDRKFSVHAGDNEETLTLEGTIYVSAQGPQAFFCNPVYQDQDGRVYLTAGTGISADVSIGDSFSQTMDETTTKTENGLTKSRGTSVKLEVRGVNPPEKIVLLQMDTSSALLSREEFASGTLPETIMPHANAAYLIVETQHKDGAVREIYDRGEESLETFAAREDGICIQFSTRLLWDGAEKLA
jgi:hypothetical protein